MMTKSETTTLIRNMRQLGLEVEEPYEIDGNLHIPYKWQSYNWQVAKFEWEYYGDDDGELFITERTWATDDMQPGRPIQFNGYPSKAEAWHADDLFMVYAREMFRVGLAAQYRKTIS